MKVFSKRLTAYVALFGMFFLFIQCSESKTEEPISKTSTEVLQGLKIAYVDIDTLLTQYDFCITLNKEMLRKEEDMKVELNKKAQDLQKDYEDFQNKLQNNIYATRERAEEEQNRILKKKDELDKLQERMGNELAAENQKNSLLFRDSINSFLRDYNKDKKYDLIISRVGDNLLLANESMNITKEIVDGLNDRYNNGSNKNNSYH